MKLDINKKSKIVIMIILLILIGIFSYLIYNQLHNPGYEDQTISRYTYKNKADIEYKVNLKANNLYDKVFLDEGQIYIAEFVDSIRGNFNYEFTGEGPIDLKGYYEIIAHVSGSSRRENENSKPSIWQRDFPLIRKKTFTSKEKSFSINESLLIDFDKYNNFAKEAIETSKVYMDMDLTIYMKVYIEGNHESGLIQKTISPSLVLPLNSPLFEIESHGIEDQEAIKETILSKLPLEKNKLLILALIIGLSCLGLIYLIFFTKLKVNKDDLEIKLDRILRKHGERLVAIENEIDTSKSIEVIGIDDLVRLADELNKPILYRYTEDYREINKFFIRDGEEIYTYHIR